MSSTRNNLNCRQTSLRLDSPQSNSLVKQNSQETPPQKTNQISIRLNTNIDKQKHFPRPKIAWENIEEVEKIQQPIIAKKCPEIRKHKLLKRQSSVDQDSILSCKEDIINKLKLLLKDDAEIPEKPNLSIFLNPNQNINERPNTKEINQKVEYKTEIPNSLFQFRQNPVKRLETNKYPHTYQDKPSEPPNIIVQSPETISEDEQKTEKKTTITDNSQPINNVIIRPSTAKSRRELFGKRTNSAFNSVFVQEGSNHRPPLKRSSSAPIRPEHAKSKFLATKRKIKVSKKNSKSSKKLGDHSVNSMNMDCTDMNTAISKTGSEIITMVSLVSPASSDIEEIPELPEEDIKSRSNSPKKILTVTRKEDAVQKTSSLRRIVKQVSFQQSSIHAIRSFSAGFPGRRNSTVTSMMLGGSLKRASTVQKKQEKGAADSPVPDDDERVPKRRLLRSRSAQVDCVGAGGEEQETKISPQSTSPENFLGLPTETGKNLSVAMEQLPSTQSIPEVEPSKSPNISEPRKEEESSVSTQSQDGQQFFTSKEKECWTLYQKMNDKGVKVNYDTLLRGMLTPTEYRNRRQSLAAIASLAEEEPEE